MKLQKVSVSGFRSLQGAALDHMGPINALVGKNNAGKSALLESLLLVGTFDLNVPEFDGLRACLPWKRDLGEILHDSRSGGKPIEIALDFGLEPSDLLTLGEWTADVAWKDPTLTFDLRMREDSEADAHRLAPIRSQISNDGVSYPLFQEINRTEISYHAAAPRQVADLMRMKTAGSPGMNTYSGHTLTSLYSEARGGSSEEFASLGLLLAWACSMRYVSRNRQSSHSVKIGDKHLLQSDGANLARFLQHLLTNQNHGWQDLTAILRRLVPSLAAVYTPIAEESTTARIAVTDSQDAASAYALEHMGAGTTHLATIISMVWSTPHGGICLIDEPEQGLHSSAQRDLAIWLDWHTRETDKQLLIATHSTIFARPAEGTSVFLSTYKPTDGTSYRPISRENAPQINDELGTRLTDFFAYDMLLFVEGPSEESALPIIAQAESIDLAQLGVRTVVFGGDPASRLQRLTEYLEYMKDSQVKAFVVLDSDAGVPQKVEQLVSDNLIDGDAYHLWSTASGGAGEFEDNFSDEYLVDAANQMAQEHETEEPLLSVQDLGEARTNSPSKMTSKVLKDIYFLRFGHDLPKPELCRRLALRVAQDIRGGDRTNTIIGVLERVRAKAGVRLTA